MSCRGKTTPRNFVELTDSRERLAHRSPQRDQTDRKRPLIGNRISSLDRVAVPERQPNLRVCILWVEVEQGDILPRSTPMMSAIAE